MRERILQKLQEFDYEAVMRRIHGDTGTTLKRLKQDNAAKKAAERAAKLKQQQQPQQQQQQQPENSSTDIRNLITNKLAKLVSESKPYQPTQADRDDEAQHREKEEAERDQGGVDDEISDMADYYAKKEAKAKAKVKAAQPTKKEESISLRDRLLIALAEGILTRMAGQAEKNIKSGAQWAGKKAKEGLASLGKKAAYGAGKLVKKGINAVKQGPTHTVGESTVFKDRIVEALVKKLTESPMEFTYRSSRDLSPEEKADNEAKRKIAFKKAMAEKRARGGFSKRQPEDEGGEGTKPGSYFTNRHGGRTEN